MVRPSIQQPSCFKHFELEPNNLLNSQDSGLALHNTCGNLSGLLSDTNQNKQGNSEQCVKWLYPLT
jgi:hypothetical protein